MNNKKLIILLAIGLVLLVGGGFLVLSGNKKAEPVVEKTSLDEQVTMIKPEEIGLTLSLSKDRKRVIIEIANTKDVSGLEYDLTYVSKGDIAQGLNDTINIKRPGSPVKVERDLGTCSDVCHYDEDVSDIKLILKVTKTDGTISQVEKSLEF